MTCPYAHPFKSNFYINFVEGGNIFEEMVKGMMMNHNNPFGNKKKVKKPQVKTEVKGE